MFRFQSEGHKYFYGDDEILSVTTVLAKAGMVSRFAKSSMAATFGTAVHKAIELLEKDRLGEYDEAIQPWLDAWELFRANRQDLSVMEEYVEQPMFSARWRFAGTPDFVFHNDKGAIIYVDLKTGVFQPYWELQAAAYAQLFEENIPDCKATRVERMALILREGTFEVKQFKKERHVPCFGLFMSALNILNWRTAHNLIGGQGDGFDNTGNGQNDSRAN